MNIYTTSILATAAIIFLCAGNGVAVNAFELPKWDSDEIILTDSITKLTVNSNTTQWIVRIADPTDASLYVWIDEMTCSSTDPFAPSYLKVVSDSTEVKLKFWSNCENIEVEDALASPYNNGVDNVGLDQVIVTPVGDWSEETNNATLRFEIRRPTKHFKLDNDVQELKLHLQSKTYELEYEIKLDKYFEPCQPSKSQTDKDNHKSNGWNCSLSAVFSNIECKIDESEEIDDHLLVTATDEDGNEEVYKCESSDDDEKKHYGSKKRSKVQYASIKSVGTIKILTPKKGKKLDTMVSVTPRLIAPSEAEGSSDSCPQNFFNCYSEEYCSGRKESSVSCIPLESTCDGKPNCPSECPNADENKKFCKARLGFEKDEDDKECYDYWYYSGGFSIWQSIFGFLFFFAGFILIGFVCRAVYLRRSAMQARQRLPPVQPYSPPRVSEEVTKVRMAPPPSYGEVTGSSYA